jgi:hypothetical protein
MQSKKAREPNLIDSRGSSRKFATANPKVYAEVMVCLLTELRKDLNGAEISKLIKDVSPGPCDSMPLTGFSLNRLNPFKELLSVNFPSGLHLQKAIQDLSFCHRLQSINHLDEHGPKVMEKFRPLIHTANRTIVSPRRPKAVASRKDTGSKGGAL